MGGYGSGGHNKRKGDLKKNRSIDIRILQKHGVFREAHQFTYYWTSQGKTSGSVECYFNGNDKLYFGQFTLNNSIPNMHPKGDFVQISRSISTFGIRTWFICPGCYRKTTTLYLNKGLLKCRICHELNYRTSQRSGDKVYQIDNKIFKIQDKLGAKHDISNIYMIAKPKWMHRKTYIKLMNELHKLEQQRENAITNEAIRRFGSW